MHRFCRRPLPTRSTLHPRVRPDQPHSVREFDVEIADGMAEVDPDLKRLIAPAADSQRKRFRNEGHFNALIRSLRSVDGTHLQVERSTY